MASIPLAPVLATLMLAVCWLLPNISTPWFSFHRDAWSAGTFCLIAIVLSVGARRWNVSFPVVVLALLSLVPFVQHLAGQLPVFGSLLVPTGYLIGFMLCVFLGENWSRARISEPLDVVLGAAFVAALISAGLTFYQMASLSTGESVYDIWVLQFNPALGRPYANLAQPNQLATLLLWGLCGLAWMRYRNWVFQPPVLAAAAAVLLSAAAFTQSRTALLTLTAVAVAAFFLRRKGRMRREDFVWIASGYAFFWLAVTGVWTLNNWFGYASGFSMTHRTREEARFLVWRVFWDAANEKPWFGYGMHSTQLALLEVFPRYPEMNNWFFNHAHNLFLDWILWFGFPLGIALTLATIAWVFQQIKRADSPDQVIAITVVCVVGIHALLELPLHYAYFLLPTGVICGYLNHQNGVSKHNWIVPLRAVQAAFVLATLFLAALVHDYLKIEERFRDLRFELQHVGTPQPLPPNDLLILKHWEDAFRIARVTPAKGMSIAELRRWEELVESRPSEFDIKQLIYAWSLNGFPEKANYWANRLCLVSRPVQCKYILDQWRLQINTPDANKTYEALFPVASAARHQHE